MISVQDGNDFEGMNVNALRSGIRGCLAALQCRADMSCRIRSNIVRNREIRGAFILLLIPVSLQGCVTLTEEERAQIAYDLNEARTVYDERRKAFA